MGTKVYYVGFTFSIKSFLNILNNIVCIRLMKYYFEAMDMLTVARGFYKK